MYQLKRTDDEIAEQRVLALAQTTAGTTIQPRRTFEEGVTCTLAWLLGEDDEPPFGLPDWES